MYEVQILCSIFTFLMCCYCLFLVLKANASLPMFFAERRRRKSLRRASIAPHWLECCEQRLVPAVTIHLEISAVARAAAALP